jgi:hypothetical protein
MIMLSRPLLEKFQNAKRIISSRKSKKDSRCNDQIKKDKRTNKGLDNIIIEAFRFQIMKVEPTKVHLVLQRFHTCDQILCLE